MAGRNLDEYEALRFYAKNTTPKKSGFSKFQVEDRYYFCRYVDGDIAMISQAYTGKPGRDNGIESVRKNEKIASRYKFDTRGKAGHGFGLKAGNGQEIAISPNYSSLGKAQSVASRMSGKSFGGASTSKKSATKTSVTKKSVTKKTRTRKTSAKTSRVKAKGGRKDNYRPLSFYETNGSLLTGFNSFEKDGAFYFHYAENDKVVLISEGYTSRLGRDNGIASAMQNMGSKTAYKYHKHKNGKHYFNLNATNGQEIATSRWYNSSSNAREGVLYLQGGKERPSKTSVKRTRTTSTRVRSTRVVREVDVQAQLAAKAQRAARAQPVKAKTVRSRSEEQNYQSIAFYRNHTKGKKKGIEKFQGDDGEYYFTYFENNKLALISEGYPTAAIRDVGVASVRKNIKLEKRYVYGTGAEGKPGFILRAGNHKEIARSVGYGSAAAAATGAAYLLGKRRRPAAKPKVKKVAVKKVAAPVQPKPKPKPKPKIVKPLTTGTVAVAGLGAAGLAAAKTNEVKKAAVPVKAAPIAPPPPPPPPAPVVAAPIKVAAPIVAAAAAIPAATIPAAAAPVAAAGIWGWLKWLLLGLLALLAALFLFKSCVGGAKNIQAPPVAAAKVALVTCWNGDKAKTDAACPTKITCWDKSFATSSSSCPTRPVERSYTCWDGSNAVNLAGCPVKPAPKVAVAPKPAPKGRLCGFSSNPLFNASRSTPVSIPRLGTNVQFGNSLTLTPNAFFSRLQNRYSSNANDKAFLDLLATSLGYGSFNNMDASMFSNDTLAYGTSGILGYGQQHGLQYSTLDVTDPTHLEAFKVRSANGTDVHFMKRCGNFMYVCEP